MESAEALFSKVMQRSLMSFGMIFTFRQTAHSAISGAAQTLRRIERGYAELVFKSPDGDRYFTDKKRVLEVLGGFDAYVAASAERRASQFTSMVEGASLIYAHSLLDGVVHDLCIVTSRLSPPSWRHLVDQRKVALRDICDKPATEIEQGIVAAYVDGLEKESLQKKIDALHAVCRPPRGFAPSPEYQYDGTRLRKLDDQRHDIVHGLLPLNTSVSPAEIEFMQGTALYMAAMVSNSFGVKANPVQMFQASV